MPAKSGIHRRYYFENLRLNDENKEINYGKD